MEKVKNFIESVKNNIGTEMFMTVDHGEVGLEYSGGKFRMRHNSLNFKSDSESEIENLLLMKLS